MKVCYIAGKLTGANNFEIARNVRAAEEAGLVVAEMGVMPLIPHVNTGMTFFGCLEERFWYDGTLELLRRCDCVYMVPGWETSKGARAEREEARRLKLPVFEDFVHLEMWLRKGGADGDQAIDQPRR